MTSLLDVNVLVALFDAAHVHHELAHRWFGERRHDGWATCPLTENGLVRVIANPSYPGSRTTVADAIERLTSFKRSGDHVFWQDSVSLTEGIDPRHVLGHRQITDVYLLALAIRNAGRLATLDRGIAIAAVDGATQAHLARLGVG